MDFENKFTKEVVTALQTLHEKITSLQEQVDRLCQTTGEVADRHHKAKKPQKDDQP